MRFVQRGLNALLNDLRQRGLIRSWTLRNSVDHDAIIVSVLVSEGQERCYSFTGIEYVNGGTEGWINWLQAITADIYSYQNEYLQVRTISWADANVATYSATLVSSCSFSSWGNSFSRESESCAAELFRLTCGQEAFDILEAGNPLSVTGSLGTQYTLHKRSTYCVERASDHTKLCAVVPGVPLWDHLLGIKLMIENDEPKFLETANVAHQDNTEEMQGPLSTGQQAMARNIDANNTILQRIRNWIF